MMVIGISFDFVNVYIQPKQQRRKTRNCASSFFWLMEGLLPGDYSTVTVPSSWMVTAMPSLT